MEPNLNSFEKNSIHRNRVLCIGLIAGLWTILVILAEHVSVIQSIGYWLLQHLTPG